MTGDSLKALAAGAIPLVVGVVTTIAPAHPAGPATYARSATATIHLPSASLASPGNGTTSAAVGHSNSSSSITVPCLAGERGLKSAITDADNRGGGTIVLQSACIYILTSPAEDVGDGPDGLPAITASVTIAGNGATIIRSIAPGTPAFRIIEVARSGRLVLTSLTVTGGLATGYTGFGGGILNFGALTLAGCQVTRNTAPGEGGGIANAGALTLTHSQVTHNTAMAAGGGIASQPSGPDPSVTLTSSQVSDNESCCGGGIFNEGSLSLTDSLVTRNVATWNGGGIWNNFGPAHLLRTKVVHNVPNDCAPPGSVSGC